MQILLSILLDKGIFNNTQSPLNQWLLHSLRLLTQWTSQVSYYKSEYMSSAFVKFSLNKIPLQFMSTLEREPFFGDLACNKLYNLRKKQSIKSDGKPQKINKEKVHQATIT